MKLALNSPRAGGARRYGLELRKAMAAQGRSVRGFAADMEISRTRLHNWLAGTSMPTVERSEVLADALHWPRLVELAKEARRKACDNCGKTFVNEHQSPRRYCSTACKNNQAKQAGARRDLSRAVLQRRVAVLDRAIAEMCGECEPSGVCQTPTCPLQLSGVSPASIARSA